MSRIADEARAALSPTRPMQLTTATELEHRRDVQQLEALERGLADLALRRSIASELASGDRTLAELDALVAAVLDDLLAEGSVVERDGVYRLA